MERRSILVRLGWGGVALLMVLALGAVGCSSSSGSSETHLDAGPTDTATGDTTPNDDIGGRPDQTVLDPEGELIFIALEGDDGISCVDFNRCTQIFGAAETRLLRVRYTEEDRGVSDVSLNFRIIDDETSLGALEPATGIVVTDANGTAGVNLRIPEVPNESVRFSVEVTAPGKRDVLPIFFDVVVAKGGWTFTIVPEYAGARTISQVKIRLYQHPEDPAAPGSYISDGVTCAELMDTLQRRPTEMPSATIVAPDVAFGQSSQLTEDYFPGLAIDEVQVYTIIATGEDNGVMLAAGCNDTEGSVVRGTSYAVTIPMENLAARLSGVYELSNRFDLVTALPANVQEYVYMVTGFFESPAGQILELLCMIDNSTVEDLCGYLLDDQGNRTAIGEVLIGIIDSVLDGISAGTVWGDILSTGEDVSDILTDLNLLSTLELAVEPDAAGLIASGDVDEQWTTVRYRWTLGQPGCATDPDCGWYEFSFQAVSLEVVEGTFQAQVNIALEGENEPHTLLTVPPHALNIRYGALLNYIIKNVVIPRLAGDGEDGLPRVDTYEELIKSLLAGRQCLQDEVDGGDTCCYTFAQSLVSDPAAAELTVNLVETACDALIDQGVDLLEAQLLGLDFETGDPDADNAFVIGTPDGMPCVLYDANDDLLIDALGRAGAPCQWEVTLRLNIGDGLDTTIDGTFTGSRQ